MHHSLFFIVGMRPTACGQLAALRACEATPPYPTRLE